MAADTVRGTVGGLQTDDLMIAVRTQRAATPYLRDLTFRQR